VGGFDEGQPTTRNGRSLTIQDRYNWLLLKKEENK